MEKPLVNRVAQSSLKTVNLEDYFPAGDIVSFDMKDYLFMEMVLKEKDFRVSMKEHDWSQYDDKHLAVHCSTDAIIPVWAWMLVTTNARPYAKNIFMGTEALFIQQHYIDVLGQLDYSVYNDQRVVVKGCSDRPVPPSAYLELTKHLTPVAKSIMYGEPCSTVPIYKKPRPQK